MRRAKYSSTGAESGAENSYSAAGYSLWSGDVSSDWDALKDGPKIAGSALPPVHVIGAGAVGNALAYIVANLGLSKGYFILIDDDKYDGTNLNRCLLAGWRDLGQHKVAAITDALHAGGVGTFPFVGVIKSYVADARTGLRTDVRTPSGRSNLPNCCVLRR